MLPYAQLSSRQSHIAHDGLDERTWAALKVQGKRTCICTVIPNLLVRRTTLRRCRRHVMRISVQVARIDISRSLSAEIALDVEELKPIGLADKSVDWLAA